MIELTRKQIHVIRSTIRQALGTTSPRRAPAVTFQATVASLVIRSSSKEISIEYQLPGSYRTHAFAVPAEALVRCEGKSDDKVTIEVDDHVACFQWSERGIPQTARFDCSEPDVARQSPTVLAPIASEFLGAMAEAAFTACSESTRYALNCVRLRGSDGQIAATDGHQALIQSGFSFPWTEDVLVHKSTVFASKEFQKSNDLGIGKSDEWMFVRSGSWTLALRIEKDARFPTIESQIPSTGAESSTMVLTEDDAEFLAQAQSRLPGASDPHSPVTIDLNGSVTVRAKSTAQNSATDLVLTNSRRRGDEMKVSTDRQYVARAIQLGFREVHFRNPEEPAFCRDDRRTYIWALLGKDAVQKPDPTATRIESPFHSVTPQSQQRFRNPMKSTQPSTKSTEGVRPANILAKAEAVRNSLTQALTDTRELIAAIKQRRKQSRLVESTLRTLKELDSISA